MKYISVGESESLENTSEEESACKPGIQNSSGYKNRNTKKNGKAEPVMKVDDPSTDRYSDTWKYLNIFKFDLGKFFVNS